MRSGDMWQSASSDEHKPGSNFIIIGNPGSRRVILFQTSLAQLKLPSAQIVPYIDLILGKTILTDIVSAGSVVRIESPGKEFEVERALLALGLDTGDCDVCLSRYAISKLVFERGRILYPRQWYIGYCEALHLIARQLRECPPYYIMNPPGEIAVMFDKGRCHELFELSGIPVPRSLGAINSFAELFERMRQANCHQVFVKLAHGSSASGVVAYRTDGRRHQAFTTVEMVRQNGELRLYNSRRIRTYNNHAEISELIDELCRHRVHVEQWLPKAGFENHTFDLRVVVIAGRARQVVVRLSHSPMTNLHLLNERGDLAAFRTTIGEEAWNEAMRQCERAMDCFPESLYAGVDLLLAPGYRRHAVLEINAFGDLLPGVMWKGEETYTTELLAIRREEWNACLTHKA